MDTLVFLDFDGVICDSAEECLVSSWTAYFSLQGTPLPSAVPANLKADFLNLRPYVRTGEDFVICQEILNGGLSVDSQEDFDRLASGKSAPALAGLRERFYDARTALLETDRDHWLRLHRLYPQAARELPRWACSPRFYILSTKRPRFIGEILAASGIAFARERILHADKTDKGARILETLECRGCRSAVLVDDQVDHLVSIQELGGPIAVYLAAWGYVKPEWLAETSIPVIAAEELKALVDAVLGPTRASVPSTPAGPAGCSEP